MGFKHKSSLMSPKGPLQTTPKRPFLLAPLHAVTKFSSQRLAIRIVIANAKGAMTSFSGMAGIPSFAENLSSARPIKTTFSHAPHRKPNRQLHLGLSEAGDQPITQQATTRRRVGHNAGHYKEPPDSACAGGLPASCPISPR